MKVPLKLRPNVLKVLCTRNLQMLGAFYLLNIAMFLEYFPMPVPVLRYKCHQVAIELDNSWPFQI